MSTSQNNLNYTDQHDVDEELRAIADFGEDWRHGTGSGIARRDVYFAPTATLTAVASLKNKNSLSQ